MMITVFGATGQVGKRIVRYALAYGHTVKAFGRNITSIIDADLRNEKLEAVKGSVFDKEAIGKALENSEAVLSALGGSFDGMDKTRSLGMKNIVQEMQQLGIKRIIALGGTGTLSSQDGNFLMDSPDFPEQFLPVAREHMAAFHHLERSDLDWTFLCAPQIVDEDRTENYVVSDTFLPEPNRNIVNAGDIADFMVKEVMNNQHMNKRVGISAL